MREITEMEMPFSRMSELADLCSEPVKPEANPAEKAGATKQQLERDHSSLRKVLRHTLQAHSQMNEMNDCIQRIGWKHNLMHGSSRRQHRTWILYHSQCQCYQ